MPGGIVSGLAGLVAASGAILFAPDVLVRGPVLHLGDVANLEAVPQNARARAAALPLASLTGSAPVQFPVATLAARARSLMPALARLLPAGPGTVRIRRRAVEPAPVMVAASTPEGVARGDIVTAQVIAGIFSIERQGVAMSAAAPGEGVFVRTADRKAISAQCCGD